MRQVREPMVEDCEKLCVFENITNSWCFETTPPILQVGWDFYQKFETVEDNDGIDIKYYQLEFIPYLVSDIYVQSLFNMSRLFFNELTADLAKFKMNLFVSFIMNGRG